MAGAFLLRKWYLDCVTDRGDTWIGYHAELRRGLLRLNYAASILNGVATDRVQIAGTRAPEASGDSIDWPAPRLGVSASFRRLHAPFSRLIFEDRSGAVWWNCVAPLMEGTVRLRHEVLGGRGYAECLEMTIAPWELPIDELRWGRFCGLSESLTWIEWRDRHPLQLVVRNGKDAAASEISDSGVHLEDGTTLEMDSRRVIRSGSLEESVRIPTLFRRLVPRPIWGVREEKRLSEGRLTRPDSTMDRGWVIDELVIFARR